MKLLRKVKMITVHNKLCYCLLLCFTISTNTLFSQTYIQARVGFVNSEYKTIDATFSNRDEHDFLGGGMLDVELGKEFGKKRVTFLLGLRLQYVQERLEGIYSPYQWNSSAKITAHSPAFLLTGGIRIKTIGKLSTLLRANFGYKYTKWYQDGLHKESFWNVYTPLSIGFEYQLKHKWNLISGFSFRPPFYTNQKYKYFIGFRKEI